MSCTVDTFVPGPLVSTEWLAAQLGSPDVRIYDCTVIYGGGGEGGPEFPSGRPLYDKRHIPGAAFADLTTTLSIHDERDNWFTLPAPKALAEAAGALGIGDGHTVVLYDQGPSMWAARVWWQLRTIGFDALVLDGGFKKWKAEGRPVSDEETVHPPAVLTPRPRPELVASKADVLALVQAGGGGSCLINSVSAVQHRGEGPASGGRRPGHIPHSVNVPFDAVLDPETNAFLPPERLRELFAAQGAVAGTPVVAYCGGAIAATNAALALELAGHGDVRVYDGSLREWAADPALPLVTGD